MKKFFEIMGGQENVENSKWLNFELRTYNADLGRFNNPDPYSQFASAYVGMGNNPVSGVDPTGGLVNNYGYVDFLGLNAQAQLSGFGNTSIRTESLSAAFSNWQDYEDMLFLELRPFGYTGGGDGGGSSIASALQRMGQYDEMMSGKTYYDVNYTKDGKTTLLGTFTDSKSANRFALGVRDAINQSHKEYLARNNPNNDANLMASAGGGPPPIFAGDKFETQMARNDVAKGSLDAQVYQKTFNAFADIASTLFLGFIPGPSFSSLSKAAFNNSYIGASSKLFGYSKFGETGILNQGVVRIGWNAQGTNYVFRGVIGNNVRYGYEPTLIFGKQIHWHTPSIFIVPK